MDLNNILLGLNTYWIIEPDEIIQKSREKSVLRWQSDVRLAHHLLGWLD